MAVRKEEFIAVDDASLEYTIIATSQAATRNLDGQPDQGTLLATLRLADGRYVARISAIEFKVLPDGPLIRLKDTPPKISG